MFLRRATIIAEISLIAISQGHDGAVMKIVTDILSRSSPPSLRAAPSLLPGDRLAIRPIERAGCSGAARPTAPMMYSAD
jgi:hypothetical protein